MSIQTSLLSTLDPPVSGLILDMDGVLWEGSRPLVDLQRVFRAIAQAGIGVVLATNNATRTPRSYLETLAQYGVTLDEAQILTSAVALASHLKDLYPRGGAVYLIGEQGLSEALEQNGFWPDAQEALAVVASLDRGLTYEKLKQATLLIRKGVPFFASNDDRTLPTPEGQVPGAGAILAALQAATDVTPWLAGKPEPALFESAMRRLGTFPQNTLVVGDRLETDILGASRAGCRSALVLSGVTTREALTKSDLHPELVLNSLEDLFPA